MQEPDVESTKFI